MTLLVKVREIMKAGSTKRLECILRRVYKDTEILILGTFPSIIALEKKEYYGNPKNNFWEILGHCLDIDNFHEFPYKERLSILKKNKIGLWDSIKSCERKTSLDVKIENEEYNDLSILRKECPNLKKIILSSKFMLQSKKRRDILKSAGIPYVAAPSPSRRYIIPMEEKKRIWKEIIGLKE